MRFLAVSNTPIFIGIITGLAIITTQVLSTMLVYNFFRFDTYLTVTALSFLAFGYFIAAPGSASPKQFLPDPASTEIDIARAAIGKLSSRELSIFQMIALGNTNKEIAGDLGIELSTVKTHINNIYTKISVTNRKEAREKWKAWEKQGLIS